MKNIDGSMLTFHLTEIDKTSMLYVYTNWLSYELDKLGRHSAHALDWSTQNSCSEAAKALLVIFSATKAPRALTAALVDSWKY